MSVLRAMSVAAVKPQTVRWFVGSWSCQGLFICRRVVSALYSYRRARYSEVLNALMLKTLTRPQIAISGVRGSSVDAAMVSYVVCFRKSKGSRREQISAWNGDGMPSLVLNVVVDKMSWSTSIAKVCCKL